MPDQPKDDDASSAVHQMTGGTASHDGNDAAHQRALDKLAAARRVRESEQAEIRLVSELERYAANSRWLVEQDFMEFRELRARTAALETRQDEREGEWRSLAHSFLRLAASFRRNVERVDEVRKRAVETAAALPKRTPESIDRAAALQAAREQTEALRPLAEGRIAQAQAMAREAFAHVPGSMPVSIYLTDESIHEKVERAVKRWLATAEVSVDERDEPVIGSWFQRLLASSKRSAQTPAGREALLTAVHVADSRLVQAQDAYVTATLLQNVGPVLQSLQPTKDAIVRAGALLIVKIDWAVQVYQLTAAQQATLDHQPQLVASPQEIIAVLQLPEPDSQQGAVPGAQQVGRGETATAAGN
jgi:hypothetical protein